MRALPPGAATTAAGPARAATHPRGLISHCRGEAALCETWVLARSQLPWPYQGFGLRRTGADEYVLVISEPPPTATRVELEALLKALFSPAAGDIVRARFPTGIDGWLEDTLVRVRLPVRDGAMGVISGHNLAVWQVPRSIGERLQYLHHALFQTREGFYVDDIQSMAKSSRTLKVPTVAITARDVDTWLTPARDWTRIGASCRRTASPAPITWPPRAWWLSYCPLRRGRHNWPVHCASTPLPPISRWPQCAPRPARWCWWVACDSCR